MSVHIFCERLVEKMLYTWETTWAMLVEHISFELIASVCWKNAPHSMLAIIWFKLFHSFPLWVGVSLFGNIFFSSMHACMHAILGISNDIFVYLKFYTWLYFDLDFYFDFFYYREVIMFFSVTLNYWTIQIFNSFNLKHKYVFNFTQVNWISFYQRQKSWIRNPNRE